MIDEITVFCRYYLIFLLKNLAVYNYF